MRGRLKLHERKAVRAYVPLKSWREAPLVPAMKQLFEKIEQEQASLCGLAQKVGVHVSTISAWQYRNAGSIDNVEAVANALGYTLVLLPVGGHLARRNGRAA